MVLVDFSRFLVLFSKIYPILVDFLVPTMPHLAPMLVFPRVSHSGEP